MATPVSPAQSRILRDYAERTPASADRYRLARDLFPSGITHDARYMKPHPVFISRAAGAWKWDLDGNSYVDYFGGHGSLLLGHNHPEVLDAVQRQLSRGTHFGASHELELEWATLIREMIPCAERVRFTASGTEATQLALRIARAYSGKPNFIRFAAHFHGWHDHVVFGNSPGNQQTPPGILPEIVSHVIVCPPNDLEYLTNVIESRDDVAAVIMEPTGATFGQIPQSGKFLADVRQLTSQHGITLILDEVITGFRCGPGGAQGFYGVTPDLTTLAKLVAGGYPGAAVVGKAEVMSVMEYRDVQGGVAPPAVSHQGTFNAAPFTAAAGIATLNLIRSSDAIDRANSNAEVLRQEMNAAIRRIGADWSVYGDFSGFHIFTNADHLPVTAEDIQSGKVHWRKLKGATRAELVYKIRAGLLLGGVDICVWPGGWTSAVLAADDIDKTVVAFERLMRMLGDEGELS